MIVYKNIVSYLDCFLKDDTIYDADGLDLFPKKKKDLFQLAY